MLPTSSKLDFVTRQIDVFLQELWTYYEKQGRHDLPWRQKLPDGTLDPYAVLVSEMMLQQTQVSRVIAKYEAFLTEFPTVEILAKSELADVLRAWQGLGYNRRAKFLWQSARVIRADGAFPSTHETLAVLPGVGDNTAGAILAYAYNQPAVFVETNIRTVFIHHFTRDVLRQALAMSTRPPFAGLFRGARHFYWALMDYGTYLKTLVRNNRQSLHYAKQSPFHGSRRQIRGQVLKALQTDRLSLNQLRARVSDSRLDQVLESLLKEQLVSRHDGKYHLG